MDYLLGLDFSSSSLFLLKGRSKFLAFSICYYFLDFLLLYFYYMSITVGLGIVLINIYKKSVQYRL